MSAALKLVKAWLGSCAFSRPDDRAYPNDGEHIVTTADLREVVALADIGARVATADTLGAWGALRAEARALVLPKALAPKRKRAKVRP